MFDYCYACYVMKESRCMGWCYDGGHQVGLQKMKIKVQKTIKQFTAMLSLSQAEGSLSISLRSSTEDYVLTVDIQNDKLPLAFMNIFDNVTDLFNFIKEAAPGAIDLVGSTLKLMVKAGVRLREVPIELTRTQVPREEMLERRLDKVEQNSKTFITVIHLQKETQRLLQEFTKKTIRPLTDEIKKLTERVATLERQQDQKPKPNPSAPFTIQVRPNLFQTIPKPTKNGSSEEPPKTSVLSDKLTRTDSPTSGTQGGNQVAATENASVRRPAKDFIFDIDLNNKYLDEFFTISGNRVTRKKDNEEIYMFSSSNPIPPTDRHCINFKIEKISEGLIWVGLLAQHKKQEQYIGEEPGILQFSLEGNKVLIDGKSFGLNIPEFKDGQLLSMEVEIPARKLRFYRNGKPNPLVKITIPESLALTKLYPYVQLISSGDTVVLL